MARPTIPPAILAQRGVPLTLIDGTTVHLCYNFRSLMRIEEEFGSLQRALNALDFGENPDAKAFSAMASLAAAGLQHEVAGPDGTPMDTADRVSDYLDTQHVQELGEAIGKAITAAFPAKVEGAQEGEEEDPTPPSPGSTGSTSASSPGGGVTTTSGGAHLLSSVPS